MENDNIQDVQFKEINKEQNNIRGKILYYSTSQVANLLEKTDSKIRYYTNVFDDILHIKISNKQRRYTDEDIKKLKFIIELKNDGMTLKQIKEYCEEVTFDESTGIKINENNPLSIQTLSKALMDEQHNQMTEFKSEIMKTISVALKNQIDIIKNNNEILNDKLQQDIAITVDEIVSEKMGQLVQEVEATRKEAESINKMRMELEEKKKDEENKNKGFFKKWFKK